MNRRHIALVALLCLMSIANGATLPPIHIDELFEKADYVLVVQISEGKTLESSGNQCGAIYTGKVVQKLKGGADSIAFGHFHGYEIGSTYLLFLTNPGTEFRPLASTNSVSMAREQEYRDKCSALLTAANIMHSGNGAIEITWAEPYKFKEAAKVASRYVILPDSVPTRGYVPSEAERFQEYVWVLASDLIEYLKTLE